MNASADSFESSKRSITNSPALVRCAESLAHNLSANEGGTPKACNLCSHCGRREVLCFVMRFSNRSRRSALQDEIRNSNQLVGAPNETYLVHGNPQQITSPLLSRLGRVSGGLSTKLKFCSAPSGPAGYTRPHRTDNNCVSESYRLLSKACFSKHPCTFPLSGIIA